MENSLLILRGLGNTPLVPRLRLGTTGGYCLNLSGFRREFSNTSSPSSCQSHCNRVKNKTIISYYIPVVEIDQFPHFKKQGGNWSIPPLLLQGGIGQFPPYFYRREIGQFLGFRIPNGNCSNCCKSFFLFHFITA